MKEFTRSEVETWAERELGNVPRQKEGLTILEGVQKTTHTNVA